MEPKAINLIIFGIGIVLSILIIRNELCELIDTIHLEQDTKFKDIKKHITSVAFWFLIMIFDITMFSLWLLSDNFGG